MEMWSAASRSVQGGSKIRLKGKGISSMKNPSVKGDQYVTVEDFGHELTQGQRKRLRNTGL